METQNEMKPNKVIFTKEAELAMDEIKNLITIDLVDYYRDRKYYPGSDVIEITANDVKMFYRLIESKREQQESHQIYRRNYSFMLIRLYSVIGIFLMVLSIPFALFPQLYLNLVQSYKDNPIPFMLFLVGLFMFIISIAFNFIRRSRRL